VRIHAAALRVRLGFKIRVCIQLREHLLQAHHAEHRHPGLVTIIAGAPVSFVEHMTKCNVGKLLAVAKDAELGLAAEDFPAANQAGLARLVGDAVVLDDLFFFDRQFSLKRRAL
jgi:hypothetical protein